MSHSLFDYIARDDDAPVIAGRQALSLASKRIEERFGNFLSRTASGDTLARLELIREDFDAVVATVCAEVGHEDVGTLTRTLWNDRIARISGENPFAKKDDDDDEDEDGDKKDKKDDKDDKDKKTFPFDKKEKDSRTASTHEARKPKLCPYHGEVMGISLAQGEAQAGFNAMAQHAWGPKHCKGDEYAGDRCNFKPEMTTQSYWDAKTEQAEKRREERQQIMEAPVAEGIETPVEPIAETPVEDNVIDVDFGDGAGGEAEVDAGLPAEELLAVAASTKRFLPLVTADQKEHLKGVHNDKRQRQYEHIKEQCDDDGKSEDDCKELAARTVNKQRAEKGETKDSRVGEALEHQDVTKNTHPEFTKEHSHDSPATPPKTEGEGSPHPTERVELQPDITVERHNPANKDELDDIGEQVTEHQDVTQESGFSNKYPERWASADAAIADFNK